VARESFPVDSAAPAAKPLEISPLSRAQESSLCDTVTMLAEANAKMGETIVAQGDQIIQLNEQLRVSRNLTAERPARTL
jgi:hypothetical protein